MPVIDLKPTDIKAEKKYGKRTKKPKKEAPKKPKVKPSKKAKPSKMTQIRKEVDKEFTDKKHNMARCSYCNGGQSKPKNIGDKCELDCGAVVVVKEGKFEWWKNQ